MQRSLLLLFVAFMVLLPVGCMDDYVPASSPPAARQEEQPPSEPPPAATAPADSKTLAPEPVVEPESKPIEAPEPAEIPPQKRSPPAAPAGPRIALDLGVALAQTGPEGIMMMFGVEYEFVSGEPDPKAKYYWVIERAKGAAKKIPCRLERKGPLNTPIFGWRPNEGPFHSHIEDGDGKRLSDSIEMR